MPTQRYSVTQPAIETLFSWIKMGEIAIPEIQRPFVWDSTKVRNLLDSLMQGYPIGYLIAWKNPDVRLKDGTSSSGKRILIDGQQRVTALMAAILGREVIDKDYRTGKIRIAYHPMTRKFEVYNIAIEKDPTWIPDIAVVFDPETKLLDLINEYHAKNDGTNKDEIFRSLEALKGITSNQIGLIELAPDLDIETVTEIFMRVNSEGVPLSQADFAMSKIAVNEAYGGPLLRKAIDYFCHMVTMPDFFKAVKNDKEFAGSEYFSQMAWLRNDTSDIYDPSYNDMLRVAFTYEFKRGRMQHLVALLSGRNFETRQYEEVIAEDSFARLKDAVMKYMNESNFKRFMMIIRSAGFINVSMIGSQNAMNFAYALYLTLKDQGLSPGEIERYVRRWYVLSVLTGRYSASPESQFDWDIKQLDLQGSQEYLDSIIDSVLSPSYWDSVLPQEMNTSVVSSPFFSVYKAAQVKLGDRGLFSNDITVRDLVEIKSDVHHIFPRDYLKRHGYQRGQYNQIANYVLTQSEINIAIGNKEPRTYFSQMRDQCRGGPKVYGNIVDEERLNENLRMNSIPLCVETMDACNYNEFLAMRRKLMAEKIKEYYYSL
jgi:hypothetical protein